MSAPVMVLDREDVVHAVAMLREAVGKLAQVMDGVAAALPVRDPALRRAEYGIATFAHTGFVFQLVHHGEALQRGHGAQECGQTGGFDGAVEVPGFIPDANHHRLSPQAGGAIGLCFDGQQYGLVVGQWLYPLDCLRVHGFLSGGDVGALVYVGKYLRKACGSPAGALLWLCPDLALETGR